MSVQQGPYVRLLRDRPRRRADQMDYGCTLQDLSIEFFQCLSAQGPEVFLGFHLDRRPAQLPSQVLAVGTELGRHRGKEQSSDGAGFMLDVLTICKPAMNESEQPREQHRPGRAGVGRIARCPSRNLDSSLSCRGVRSKERSRTNSHPALTR